MKAISEEMSRDELITEFLGAHVHACAAYSFSIDQGKTWCEVPGLGILSTGDPLQREVLRNKTVQETRTEVPSPGVFYANMRVLNDDGSPKTYLDPPANRAASPDATAPRPATSSEEQRMFLLTDQRAASVAATTERAFMMDMMKTMRDEAAIRGKEMFEAQQRAEEQAAQERKYMRDEATLAEAKAGQQRTVV